MSKAIIIDSKNKNIYCKEINSLKDIQEVVGGLITSAFYNQFQDVCYVNDEGLFDDTLDFFTYEGAHQPFAGNGVLLGTDSNGNDIDALISCDEVKKKVKFHDRDMIRKEFL